MVATPPRNTATLRGTLAVAEVRRGTASRQQALVLDSEGGERLVLIRLGGAAFGLPPEAALAGRRAEVTGYRLDGELRYTRLVPL